MATPTVENYLKALLALTGEDETVSVSDLSNELGVSKPSANSMVKKLHERGLIHYKKYRPLRLTETGRRQAALIVRKHRLTEMFLVEKMGFGWEEVHPIAEQMEHIKSPEFFERMDELMGSPDFDPHGSPIPDKDGNIAAQPLQKLSTCVPAQTVVLAGLNHSSTDFLHYLNARKLQLGTEITIGEIEPFDGSMQVSYHGHSAELSRQVTERLLVTPLPPRADGSATK